MSFRAYVRRAEAEARRLGIGLSMARLRDIIARAHYNRPYATALAAEKAGRLAPLSSPPPYLAAVCETYRLDAAVLGDALARAGVPDAAAPDGGPAHPILAARSVKQALRLGHVPALKALSAWYTALPTRGREVADITLGTVVGTARLLAEFGAEALARPTVRIAVVGNDPPLCSDHGRIMHLVSGLLTTDATFSFDFIRDAQPGDPVTALGETHTGLFARYLSAFEPGRFFHSAADYDFSVERPDLVVVIYPDWVDEVDTVRSSPWLIPALRAQVPVLGLSYDELEREIIDACLQGHGIGRLDTLEGAAFATLELPYGMVNEAGRYLFRIAPNGDRPGELVDGRMMALARELVDLTQRGRAESKAPHLFARVVTFDARSLAFGADNRALDLATGERFTIETVTDEGMGLQGRGSPEDPWTAPSDPEALTPGEILLLVDHAFGERMFPENVMTGGIDDESLASIVGDMRGEDADACRAYLKGMFSGETMSGVEQGKPLFVAAHNNDADAIRPAVTAGADPNEYDTEWWTPLGEAAGANSPDAARALIECGADPNLFMGMGRKVPLWVALSRSHDATALVLLEGGALLDVPGDAGSQPREYIERGICKSPAILAWVREHG